MEAGLGLDGGEALGLYVGGFKFPVVAKHGLSSYAMVLPDGEKGSSLWRKIFFCG
jgi:hypothetical protein